MNQITPPYADYLFIPWQTDPVITTADDGYWNQPAVWNLQAAVQQRTRLVWCAGDLFADHPDLIAPRARLLQRIATTPHLTWCVVTESPAAWEDRLHDVVHDTHDGADMIANTWLEGQPLPNLCLGVPVVDQATANDRLPVLLAIPAARRFVQCVPAERIDLAPWLQVCCACEAPVNPHRGSWQQAWGGQWEHACDEDRQYGYCDTNSLEGVLDWLLITGAEEPVHPDWVRLLRDDAVDAEIPMYFAGWGDWMPLASADEASHYPTVPLREGEGIRWVQVGTQEAGRVLDGREYTETMARHR